MLAVRDTRSVSRRHCAAISLRRWFGFVGGRRAGGYALEVLLLGAMQDGLIGMERLRGPPVDGVATLNVVDEEGDTHHEGAAEDHDGDEEPPQAEKAVVDDGEQGGGAGGRMNRLGERHEGGGGGTGECSADVLDTVEVVAEEKQLGDSDANDGRQHLAEERIARLRERRFYRVEFEDSGRPLVKLVNGDSKCFRPGTSKIG